MKFFFALTLATFAVASPVALPEPDVVDAPIENTLSVRATGITENEYTLRGCRKVIFFFARGSTEVGNMVSQLAQHTMTGSVPLNPRNRAAPLDHQPQMG
jgi:hypothetical protein